MFFGKSVKENEKNFKLKNFVKKNKQNIMWLSGSAIQSYVNITSESKENNFKYLFYLFVLCVLNELHEMHQ